MSFIQEGRFAYQLTGPSLTIYREWLEHRLTFHSKLEEFTQELIQEFDLPPDMQSLAYRGGQHGSVWISGFKCEDHPLLCKPKKGVRRPNQRSKVGKSLEARRLAFGKSYPNLYTEENLGQFGVNDTYMVSHRLFHPFILEVGDEVYIGNIPDTEDGVNGTSKYTAPEGGGLKKLSMVEWVQVVAAYRESLKEE